MYSFTNTDNAFVLNKYILKAFNYENVLNFATWTIKNILLLWYYKTHKMYSWF